MPEANERTSSRDAIFQPLLETWKQYVQQANETTRQTLEQVGIDADPLAWRRGWFDALSHQTDEFFRSPTFLGMLKRHVDSVIDALQRSRPVEGGGTSTDRLDGLEQEMSVRIDQIERDLERIEKKIGRESRPEFASSSSAEQFEASKEARGASPYEVVDRCGTMRLLRYKNRSVRFVEPVLICYALVNRPYILDLQSERSVVRKLCDAGFDVYLIDWGVPRDADRNLKLEDYVCRLMKRAGERALTLSGAERLHLLGYCMGGTMSTMFTALFPERVRNLVLMAAPIDFSGDDGLLNLWARDEYFDVDRLVETCGNCPGEFLNYCFQLMKPVQNFGEKYAHLCDHLEDDAFLRNFLAMEQWTNDSIPVAGETFREFVKEYYQRNGLVRGEIALGGAPIRLAAIECPVLLLVAEKDHLVPPRSTLALERLTGSVDVRSLVINSGHVGLAVSSKAHRELWPQVMTWMAERSTNTR